MFAVRTGTLADRDAIMQLAASVPEAPRWGPRIYESYLEPGPLAQICFVLASEQRIIGFIAGTAIHDFCELDSIVVSDDTRGIGAGKALLAALVEWARTRSASRMQLEVRAGNAAAISFYGHAGFHADGSRPGYYRSPNEDAVLMSRSLEASPQS